MLPKGVVLVVLFTLALVSGEARAQSPELIDALRKASEANNGGDLPRATHYYERVLEMTRREFGPDDTNTAIIENNLASLYLTQERYAEAEKLLLHSRVHLERFFGADSPNVAIAANNLGGVYAKTGRLEQAAAQYTLAMDIWLDLGGEEYPNVREMRRRLADLRDKAMEARLVQSRASAAAADVPTPSDDPRTAESSPLANASGAPGRRQAAALGSVLDDALGDKLVSGAPLEEETPTRVAAGPASAGEAPSESAPNPLETPRAKAAAAPRVTESPAAKVAVASPTTGKAAEAKEARWRVQVASMKDASRTEAEWQRLKKLYTPALDELTFEVSAADLGPEKGVFHRVYAAPLTLAQAQALCAELKKRGAWCQPRRY